MAGFPQVVRLLLESGADPNIKDVHGILKKFIGLPFIELLFVIIVVLLSYYMLIKLI